MTLQPELPFVTHRNHYLFSDYYLTHRVAERQEWQELDARPHLDALRQLWAERRAALVNANEQQTEADWIRPVLSLLGHHFAPQVSLSTPQGVKTPDYILCPDEAARTAVQTLDRPAAEADLAVALAVADAKAWDRPLDRSLPGAGVKTLHQHPGLQIDFYIRHSGLAWGVLTNGRLWQIFHKDSSKKLDVYYQVDLPALLEADDAEAFKYFWLFLRRQAFQPGSAAPGAPAWLDLVLAESAAYQRGVSDSLKEQVYDALQSLAQGFLDFPGNGLATDPASLQAIYDHSLLVLYRLLFILYAEDRELLPVRANTAYRESYSLHALKRRIAEEMDRGQPAVASMSGLWSRLSELWWVIDQGNGQLGVPAYNGGLFKPANHPWLEQQRVGDLHLRTAIDLLARTRDPKTGGREFVDYRDLEIRHLGSIYEGLLEYRVVVDSRPLGFSETPRVSPLDDSETPRVSPLDDSETPRVSLLTDKGERKATGSYYTPDYIVQYIVEHTVGPALAEAAAPYLDAAGNVRDAAGLERAVLGVNVLDPAMGSGHFLVAAADAMARFLVEKGAVEGKDGKVGQDRYDGDGESQVAYWRRRVAQACIYGVDLNPLAVELAKLSLWLATVSKDKPLSFLDHHLRCGNSLIGARVADLPLGAAPGEQVIKERRAAYKARQAAKKKEETALAAGQLTMLDDSSFAGAMHTASGMMRLIEDLGSETLADVQRAEEVYRDSVRAVTEKSRLLADVWTARHFGLVLDDITWGGLSRYILHGGFETPGYQAIIEQARVIAEQRRFFHWELEFPEVFFDGYGRLLTEEAGFDAVIGNPPWLGVRTGGISDSVMTWLRSEYSCAVGQFDLAAVFLEASDTLCRSDHRVGMVVPKRIATNESYSDLRKTVGIDRPLVSAIDLGVAFEGVNNDALIWICGLPKSGWITLGVRTGRENLHDWTVPGESIERMPFNIVPVNSQPADVMLVSRVMGRTVVRLGDHVSIVRGAECGMNHVAISKAGGPDSVLLVDHLDVERYVVGYSGWTVDPAKIEASILKPLSLYQQVPKLLVRFLSASLVVGKDTVGYASTNLVYHLHQLQDSELALDYLCAVLCSRLLTHWYRTAFQNDEVKFPHVQISHLRLLPIPQVAFTTPSDERQRLAEKGRRLYGQFCAKEDYACVLGFVEQQTAQQPERSDVVHDLLAFLAEQMIELNKQRQKLEQALDPFKFLDRNAPCQPLPKVFAAGIKYGELVRSADPAGFGNPQGLDAARHDVEGLRLILLSGQRVELQALLKHRSPASDWSGWQYEADGKSIVRAWTPIYRFDLDPAEARFYSHALPVLAQFNHAGKFPGGKTKTTMQKLQAVKLPIFDASLDLTPLEELHAELAAVRAQIQRTDRLIDQVVYRLYGLTEEEIAVVEGSV